MDEMEEIDNIQTLKRKTGIIFDIWKTRDETNITETALHSSFSGSQNHPVLPVAPSKRKPATINPHFFQNQPQSAVSPPISPRISSSVSSNVSPHVSPPHSPSPVVLSSHLPDLTSSPSIQPFSSKQPRSISPTISPSISPSISPRIIPQNTTFISPPSIGSTSFQFPERRDLPPRSHLLCSSAGFSSHGSFVSPAHSPPSSPHSGQPSPLSSPPHSPSLHSPNPTSPVAARHLANQINPFAPEVSPPSLPETSGIEDSQPSDVKTCFSKHRKFSKPIFSSL
eukprot:TRINITY_DN3585_c0_g1_i1.p1 TRINITY_DN3585_c0_g1~~TRINITY_DN3585_c0_g1_i1.p1  ORF type:complete len:291 (+),score=74.10 TRINITY_DN3585_c0_g1_i1:30-875(+)